MRIRTILLAAIVFVILAFVVRAYSSLDIRKVADQVVALLGMKPRAEPDTAAPKVESEPADPNVVSVELSEKQLSMVKIEPVGTYKFDVKVSAVGSIDFNQDRVVQVFTPYQGKIASISGQIGDAVKAGQVLFTVESYDLLQAESTLIQTAGVLDLTTSALKRAQKLVPAGGGAQKDLEQAVSDHQTAEGNYNAAHDALRVFGKTDADIEQIVMDKRVDATLAVKSPIDGVISARNGDIGLLVQPGGSTAPFTVADVSTKWMNASVPESQSPAMRRGQAVEARMLYDQSRVFQGVVTTVGQGIDPATRTVIVRSEIKDPEQLVRPGLFATFDITTGPPIESVALPLGGIVREGDGTMNAWVTTDRHKFIRRFVTLGLQQKGQDQILAGLRKGDLAVTDGAIFLNNILNAPPSD